MVMRRLVRGGGVAVMMAGSTVLVGFGLHDQRNRLDVLGGRHRHTSNEPGGESRQEQPDNHEINPLVAGKAVGMPCVVRRVVQRLRVGKPNPEHQYRAHNQCHQPGNGARADAVGE
jgi:hypothetical protein